MASRRDQGELVVTVTERERGSLDTGCLRGYMESFGRAEHVSTAPATSLCAGIWKWRFADSASAESVRAVPTHVVTNVRGKDVKIDVN